METIDAIGKVINLIILSIVAILFAAGIFYQAIELIKKK
jgi:hypothetical protein